MESKARSIFSDYINKLYDGDISFFSLIYEDIISLINLDELKKRFLLLEKRISNNYLEHINKDSDKKNCETIKNLFVSQNDFFDLQKLFFEQSKIWTNISVYNNNTENINENLKSVIMSIMQTENDPTKSTKKLRFVKQLLANLFLYLNPYLDTDTWYTENMDDSIIDKINKIKKSLWNILCEDSKHLDSQIMYNIPKIFWENVNLLIVDDDKHIQFTLNMYLNQKWCQNIKIVSNWMEAVSICEIYDFDLIFMDIVMPEMSWDKAAESIKSSWKDTYIIALTSLEKLHEYYNYFDSYLQKWADILNDMLFSIASMPWLIDKVLKRVSK